MSKGAIVLSGVPTVIGGTLGQQVEHDQDKNIIIYGGSAGIGSGVLTNYANISHTHGTPTVIGSISVTSVSSGWTISIPAFLTTAALGTHIHGSINVVPIAGSTASYSSASSGLTVGFPAWITTAAQSIHTHNYAGTGTTINGAGSDFFDVTLNSNGIVFDISAVPGGADGYNRIVAGTQTGTSAGSIVFSNSNGISFGMSGNTRVTASYSQSTHDHPYVNTNVSSAFLTTARSSNDAIGLNTAQTNVTWTADSRGLSINAAGYAGTLTSGTNIGLSVNSLGISASIDTAGMTALGDGVNILAAGSVTAGTVQTIIFSDSNGISFGMHSDSTFITAHIMHIQQVVR